MTVTLQYNALYKNIRHNVHLDVVVIDVNEKLLIDDVRCLEIVSAHCDVVHSVKKRKLLESCL